MIDDFLGRIPLPDLENLLNGDLSGQTASDDEIRIYPGSRRTDSAGVRYMSLRDSREDRLIAISKAPGGAPIPESLSGTIRTGDGRRLLIARQNSGNAGAMREIFPHLRPSCAGPHRSSFGLGDRLGIASVGHIRLFGDTDVLPVLAQQSLRELDLMGRTYRDVIDAATWAVFNSGYEGLWLADGDHLKTESAVISALTQGCTMITADLSDHLAFEYTEADSHRLSGDYAQLDAGWRGQIEERYQGEMQLDGGVILNFEPETLQRIALTYSRALDHAQTLYRACRTVAAAFDFEISIDETDLPTSPEAHYFVARELQIRRIPFTSLAPRFVGEFQKGIDYIGDIAEFGETFAIHAIIAGELGYKISIHSSSDKFSVYPIIGRLVNGACHLKTSGTNWLVALETIAGTDPEFFRELFTTAYEVFPAARTYYHITPDMSLATDIRTLPDHALGKVFTNPTDRQVLHVSYGELFRDAELKSRYFAVLRGSIEEYWTALEQHIGRHLNLLAGV